MRRWSLTVVLLVLVAGEMLASPALYLPGLVALDAGWSRHFLRRGISHFNGGEYIYALEDFDSALAHSPNAGTAAFAHMYKGRALFALKNYAKARAEFETAFATSPEAGLIYAAAGSSAFGASRFAEALEFFQRGLKAAPHHDLLLNNFAWFRATCPDAAFRNGAEAVRFAREACERASWKDSVFMDTLAAAQAEAGHFAEAVNTEGRALADKDAERLEKSPAELRLRQFSQHQPYRAKQGR